MRQLLQLSCGLSGTPLGNIDFTGRWYTEEPLSIFRPSLTLTIDEKGRRWIAEVNRNRGLPSPCGACSHNRRLSCSLIEP
jgi:hypothetical protein